MINEVDDSGHLEGLGRIDTDELGVSFATDDESQRQLS